MSNKSKIGFLKLKKKAVKFSAFLLIAGLFIYTLFSVGIAYAKDINFGTSGDKILLNGNVGVGTTNPGAAKLNVISGTPGISVTSSGTNYNEGIRIHPSSANSYSSIELNAISGDSGTGPGQWTLFTGPGVSNGFGIDYAGTTNLFVATSGNIGIGNTAPETKLHIGSNDGAKDNVPHKRLSLEPPSHTGGAFDFQTRDDATYAYFDLGYAGSQSFTLNSSGNVGIGTTNPVVKLDVKGKAQIDNSGTYSTTYSWAGGAIQTNSLELMDRYNGSTGDGVYPTLTFHDYGNGGAQFSMEGLTTTLHLGSGQSSSAGTLAVAGGYFSKLKIWGALETTGAMNVGGSKINNLGVPVVASDAATKGYVDSSVTSGNADTLDGLHSTTFQQRVSYSTGAGNSGYYKINILPATSWMLSFTIRLYQGYRYDDIRISGYNYGGNYWYSPMADLLNSSATSIDVQFGYDSAYNLWVAVPASAYTGLEIIDITNGYTQVNQDWSKNFSIVNQASLTGTVQTTQTVYRPLKYNENATSATNADTVDGLHVNAGRNNAANQIVRTDASGYLQTGYINSDSGNEGNNSNPPRIWGTNGSDTYLRTYMTSALSVNYANSAGSATTFSSTRSNYKGITDTAVAGEIMWKNYGNGHTIIDLSNSTAPNGSSHNNTNSEIAWSAQYPALMGWNGSNTYGVRVDSARIADSAGSAASAGSATNASNITGGSLSGNLVATNYGIGNIGVYTSDRYQAVWSMGPAYVLPADGSSPGNLYGLAWTHTNVGGQSKAGLSHQLLVMENGTTKVALGSGIWTSGTVSAPTLDASGYVYGAELYTRDNIYIGYMGNWLSNLFNQSVTTGASPTFANTYLNGWLYNSGRLGIYNSTQGTHFYADSASVWRMSSNNGMIFNSTTAYDSAIAGYVYHDGSGFGMLNNQGSWMFYAPPNSTNVTFPGSISAAGFIYNSDQNLKKNIATIENPLEKILQLRGVTFNWKKDNTPSVGLIAQEVEKVFPELVVGEEGKKGVQYGNLVAPLIEAVKAQQKEIEDSRIQQVEDSKAQQKEIDALKSKIKTLELKNRK